MAPQARRPSPPLGERRLGHGRDAAPLRSAGAASRQAPRTRRARGGEGGGGGAGRARQQQQGQPQGRQPGALRQKTRPALAPQGSILLPVAAGGYVPQLRTPWRGQAGSLCRCRKIHRNRCREVLQPPSACTHTHQAFVRLLGIETSPKQDVMPGAPRARARSPAAARGGECRCRATRPTNRPHRWKLARGYARPQPSDAPARTQHQQISKFAEELANPPYATYRPPLSSMEVQQVGGFSPEPMTHLRAWFWNPTRCCGMRDPLAAAALFSAVL